MRHKHPPIIGHLTLTSVKHDICVAELFKALGSAREHGKTSCQNLAIEYRGSIAQEAIFLITEESAVVAQFRVPEEFLKRKDILFESWMDSEKIRRQIKRQKTRLGVSMSIQNLQQGMKRVNVDAEVLEKSLPARVQTHYGNSAVITNAIIGDETGKVRLCLWNEQGDWVNAGVAVQIRNASVFAYKGERQLRLGRRGTVSVLSRGK